MSKYLSVKIELFNHFSNVLSGFNFILGANVFENLGDPPQTKHFVNLDISSA